MLEELGRRKDSAACNRLSARGADTVAANGAVINKVGTSLIALAAHEARVRTFVIATTHKFSTETVFGELVKLPVVEGARAKPARKQASSGT
jgi:translation initiation factor 2B subunit (eIF-2B alpha/beta/delta family)